MINPETLLYALSWWYPPVLLWLWFWLKEDARHPEPRGLIVLIHRRHGNHRNCNPP